jgi:predicted 3-demethylubiquinone-9 3-methyltransferase (glyoxalase superfamily)
MKDLATFFMFSGDNAGRAKEAIESWVALFPDSKIESIEFNGPDRPDPADHVRVATFTLKGRRFMAIDSSAPHAFDFTPSMSLFVDCDDEGELVKLHDALLAGGQALMPLANYGFSRMFAWVTDRYGISWQLNLPE